MNLNFLDFEYSIHRRRRLRLQQCYCDIVDGNPSRRFPIKFAMVSMAMHHEIGAMPIDNFRQSRCAHKRINLGSLAFNRAHNWRIVQHYNALLRSQLRHCAL